MAHGQKTSSCDLSNVVTHVQYMCFFEVFIMLTTIPTAYRRAIDYNIMAIMFPDDSADVTMSKENDLTFYHMQTQQNDISKIAVLVLRRFTPNSFFQAVLN